MQTLYASQGSESDNIKTNEKFLLQSLNSMYDLFLAQLSLLLEVHKKAKDRLEKSQQKLLATQEDKNPNAKFVNNEVLKLISLNENLKGLIEDQKANLWYLDFEYVEVIYKDMLKSDLYKDYMATKVSTFNDDKNFVIDLFTEVIAPNDKLYDYFEDKRITWLDDLPVVNTVILKLLKKVKSTTNENFFTPELFRDVEDKEFGIDLLKKTILNQLHFNEEISAKTKNWDAERITHIDTVLMQMAICEFQKFPSIPVKVTINEYLEIAKEYSTPKSSTFINGILDKIIKEYSSNGQLNKVGRGLL
ncbi:MAG: transcription antitermination factor NusB [Psychroserpens sp.]|nr:transcription antitermination factor NusB [Psychroserpens sp.]MBO6607204.1 transcription antitermination factor NusB [Psychroserpens sp.]MBO6630784.1 transcription antitermination factor NusB [Psychroserpens sp.]MBO6654350.1 transcription antitermination factor NusB [Psychroserpens sp.]MBO6682364.1 transcription antitermination factor NusB [Psychroserpens sp.]MBO6750976.1 transcription antitermination factor NusB [Psychroserpens sp.]